MVKVNFDDCAFKDYEPHHEIEYNGRKYRAVDFVIYDENGEETWDTIAEYRLTRDLEKEFSNWLDCSLDEEIAYYAYPDEMMYSIIEEIIGEKIEMKDALYAQGA